MGPSPQRELLQPRSPATARAAPRSSVSMANTYTSLHYHIVFSTKDRELWITPDIDHPCQPQSTTSSGSASASSHERIRTSCGACSNATRSPTTSATSGHDPSTHLSTSGSLAAFVAIPAPPARDRQPAV